MSGFRGLGTMQPSLGFRRLSLSFVPLALALSDVGSHIQRMNGFFRLPAFRTGKLYEGFRAEEQRQLVIASELRRDYGADISSVEAGAAAHTRWFCSPRAYEIACVSSQVGNRQ